MSINHITLIGSGNVATALGTALKNKGVMIDCVFSRSLEHAKVLGEKLGSAFTDQPGQVSSGSDLYIIAVKDDMIEPLSGSLNVQGLVVHTSGSTPVDALKKHHRNGVFYPLQTFNKNTITDFSEVPFLIEANNDVDRGALTDLAKKLSSNVQPASTQQRQALHVAAVFANNFTNHMLAVSRHLLDSHSLSFDLLKPLIHQTIQNALNNDPAQIQTGPAIRYDERTLKMHTDSLKGQPSLEKIYRLITESIQHFHTEKS